MCRLVLVDLVAFVSPAPSCLLDINLFLFLYVDWSMLAGAALRFGVDYNPLAPGPLRFDVLTGPFDAAWDADHRMPFR